MKDLPPLEDLSSEGKDALIRELWQVVQALQAEVEKLKGKLVKKTPRNSSVPPAKGFKPNSERSEFSPSQRTASVGRAGDGRELSASPDQVVGAQVSRCPYCGTAVERASQQFKAVYERSGLNCRQFSPRCPVSNATVGSVCAVSRAMKLLCRWG